ncbi:MAG: class I SAM-dependent methyltransferase [Acidobacteriaceae bacterium]|nr:class I SAM-dependent methyltransferase [Acidobacteriaceae bacterium]
MAQFEDEVRSGERFQFGANWTRFLRTLDEDRIRRAEDSLKKWLGVDDLHGKRVLDIGSGSGLFSLAFRRLGASVYSFDYDPNSVNCTKELKRRFFADDPDWKVEQGSALDADYLRSLGRFDIVYSWGVLHHTGSMWQALENATIPVAEHGRLFVAIYNDQGKYSRRWTSIKRIYNRSPWPVPGALACGVLVHQWWRRIVKDFLLLRPFKTWREYGAERGMSPWHDVVDWVGGYPFEVAKPEQIFDFYHSRGFELDRMMTDGGGLGCNQFVFTRGLRVEREASGASASRPLASGVR